MNQKEELINSLVIDLADSTDLSVRQLKNIISSKLYDYSIDKIDETGISTRCNGNITEMLWDYFEVGNQV